MALPYLASSYDSIYNNGFIGTDFSNAATFEQASLAAAADLNAANVATANANAAQYAASNYSANAAAANAAAAADLSAADVAAANASAAQYAASNYAANAAAAKAAAAADLSAADIAAANASAAKYAASNYSANAAAANAAAAADLTVANVAAANMTGYGYPGLNYATAVQRYATDAQGLFQDANPHIIRRPAPSGPLTYTQNIKVRFLQPPPVPPHGPLIIKEVRPPQPAPPPPLRLRQQAPPLPTPPPLVLRERPPVPPAAVAAQTVIRRLAAVPVPPRSVVIERLPPAPPRPRNIVIERWIPYGAQAKRRTIVQRAGPAHVYQQPRNVVVQYDQAPARVIRQFQRLGVTAESPAAYVQRHGGSLLDSQTLVQQARVAGVVEDISAPGFVGSYASGASSSLFNGALGYNAANTAAAAAASAAYDYDAGVYDYDGLAAGSAGVLPYATSAYSSAYDLGGLNTVYEGTGLATTTTYQAPSFTSTFDAPLLATNLGVVDTGLII